MKRCVFLVVMAALAAGSLFAQDAGQWTIGGRLGFGLGFHKAADDMDDNVVKPYEDYLKFFNGSLDKKMKGNFALAFYGNYAFNDKLSIQPEFAFMINQGLKYEWSVGNVSGTTELFYKSLDIPVLIKYELMDAPVVAGILGGPHLSFPLGEGTLSVSQSPDVDGDLKGVTFGLTLGGYVGYPLGPGRIVGDLRFVFDLNAVKGEYGSKDDFEFLKRRALALTVGYEISL